MFIVHHHLPIKQKEKKAQPHRSTWLNINRQKYYRIVFSTLNVCLTLCGLWTQAISNLSIRIVLIRIRSVCFHSAFCGNAMMREFSVFHDMRKSRPPIKSNRTSESVCENSLWFPSLPFFSALLFRYTFQFTTMLSGVYCNENQVIKFRLSWRLVCITQLTALKYEHERVERFSRFGFMLRQRSKSSKNKHFSIEAHNISGNNNKRVLISLFTGKEYRFTGLFLNYLSPIAERIIKHCGNCIWFHGTNFTSLHDFHFTQ